MDSRGGNGEADDADDGALDSSAGEGDRDEVVVPIEDCIDLHAFAPRDISAVVTSYLEAAVEAGFREVRLIHGRGVGVQRANIRALLARHPAVLTFHDDDPLRGGWGATIVTLAATLD